MFLCRGQFSYLCVEDSSYISVIRTVLISRCGGQLSYLCELDSSHMIISNYGRQFSYFCEEDMSFIFVLRAEDSSQISMRRTVIIRICVWRTVLISLCGEQFPYLCEEDSSRVSVRRTALSLLRRTVLIPLGEGSSYISV